MYSSIGESGLTWKHERVAGAIATYFFNVGLANNTHESRRIELLVAIYHVLR